jgi:hypothetical protein
MRLAQPLAVQASRVGGDHVATRDNPDDAVWLVSRNDGKPPDVLACHMIDRIPERRIVEHDGGRPLDDAAYGRGRRTAVGQVPSRDDSDETVGIVDHWITLVCRPLCMSRHPRADVLERIVCAQENHRRYSDVRHEHLIEEVGHVVAHDARTAAGDLFSHDRVPHQHR